MAYRWELDDRNCHEVMFINSYALAVGYLSMAIKGLGFLILTWTTVVLLGGFVSMLQKKDFSCLTFITLVQTAGIFDVYQNEKLSYKYIVNSALGLAAGAVAGIIGDVGTIDDGKVLQVLSVAARYFLAYVSLVIQMLVLAILLCPLAVTYIFGLLISMGISIWRLVQHDYGSNSDGEANLKPAMDTLYYLALLQGVLFCYRFLFSRTRNALANRVIAIHDMEEDREVVLTYLREIRIGCEKDPLFAKGRNLITHAVDLIGSKSRDECLSGVKMLYTARCMGEKTLKKARIDGDPDRVCCHIWKQIIERHMMMKNLIISTSSSPVLHKLLQTLDPGGAFDRETRRQGATIVAHLALDIHLEQFPGAIRYICTLIGSFEEYRLIEPYHRDRLLHKYDQDWNPQASRLASPGNDARNIRAYEKLVLTGLCILRKLATHENNCRIISHTQGLLRRIMAPLTSDMIHRFNNCAWSIRVVEESLKVMFQLVAAHGETGAKLRREISSNKEAISNVETILNCEFCSAKLQKRAVGILIKIYMDTKRRETYIKMLVDIFADDAKDKSIRNLAGEALAKLSIQDGSNTTIILQANREVVGTLTKILLVDDAENTTCRIRAAEILEQICIHLHHTQDDESLSKLKKDMKDTMPKVLALILPCGRWTENEIQALTEADQIEFPDKEVDIENQCYNPQHTAMNETPSSTRPQNYEDEGEIEAELAVKEVAVKGKVKEVDKDMEMDELDMDIEVDELDNDEYEEFRAPLLSLFVTVCDIFVSADEDLACQFGAVKATGLPRKLELMVAYNVIPILPCLRLKKLICKMVISMMKHRGTYLKENMDSLMEAISSATESMHHVDISMCFASEDDGAATTMKPVRSLVSLVKEAKESVDAYFEAQESGNIEAFTSTNE